MTRGVKGEIWGIPLDIDLRDFWAESFSGCWILQSDRFITRPIATIVTVCSFMAELINCSLCGKEISSKAKACPHCGDPAKGKIKKIFTNAKEGWKKSAPRKTQTTQEYEVKEFESMSSFKALGLALLVTIGFFLISFLVFGLPFQYL